MRQLTIPKNPIAIHLNNRTSPFIIGYVSIRETKCLWIKEPNYLKPSYLPTAVSET